MGISTILDNQVEEEIGMSRNCKDCKNFDKSTLKPWAMSMDVDHGMCDHIGLYVLAEDDHEDCKEFVSRIPKHILKWRKRLV